MTGQKQTFESLINSLSLINTMDTGQGALQAIAEYYGLQEYRDFFEAIRDKAMNEDYFLSKEEIQQIITKQNEMIEQIRMINPVQADDIEVALINL